MDANVKKQVSELNAKWRNTVAQAMGMDIDSNFQIAQGDLGLSSTDSSGLFLMSDAVPPSSAAAYYTPDYTNRRSSAYGMLLGSLLPEGGQDLVDCLGDMYPSWLEYRNKLFSDPSVDMTQEQAFEKWANRNLDPRESKKAITVFKQAENAPLYKALDEYSDKANKQTFTDSTQSSYTLYKYTSTINQAKDAIATGSSLQDFHFDSSKAESKLNHTFVDGGASGFYSIFSGGAGGSFESLDQKAAAARITIDGTINKYQTLPTGPLGWYESGEVNKALNHKDDNNVWDPKAQQSWSDFFEQPNGSLARYVEQFLLVSGYDLTVSIHASFSQEEFEQIKTKAKFGIWPFFSATAEAVHTTDYKLEDDGTLTYKVTSNPGNIKIWGVTYNSIEK
jgi:hypothetical protein